MAFASPYSGKVEAFVAVTVDDEFFFTEFVKGVPVAGFPSAEELVIGSEPIAFLEAGEVDHCQGQVVEGLVGGGFGFAYGFCSFVCFGVCSAVQSAPRFAVWWSLCSGRPPGADREQVSKLHTNA